MKEREKTCFKCNERKPVSMFYKHKGMADGYLNKCKECAKYDSIKTRNARIDHYRVYDRERGNRQSYEYVKQYRSKYPKKHAAHRAVANAIRAGVLVASPCEICGSSETLEAHHDDYAKQLDIRWLCSACHSQWHVKHGSALNDV